MMKNCLDKIRIILWKRKALERRAQHKTLQKRFKEIEESRDNWKVKFAKSKQIIIDLEKENKSLKKDLKKNQF